MEQGKEGEAEQRVKRHQRSEGGGDGGAARAAWQHTFGGGSVISGPNLLT